MKATPASTYDAIVIGGGHNGLTTAAALAQKGLAVLLLERRATIGGLAAGEEFHPGYRTTGLLHDTSRIRPRAVKTLNLKRHGLKLTPRRPAAAALAPGGRRLWIDGDLKKTVAALAHSAPRDAARYPRYRQQLGRLRHVLRSLMDTAPAGSASFGAPELWGLVRNAAGALGTGPRSLLELARILPMCVADGLDEWFDSDLLKALLAARALQGSFAGPWTPGTHANLLWWEAGAWCSIEGGPRALVEALERAARHCGVEIRTACGVRRLRIRDGAVRGVVLEDGREIDAPLVAAACDPRHTLLDLVPPGALAYPAVHHMQNFRGDGILAKVHLALDGPLAVDDPSGRPVASVLVAENLTGIEKAFDAAKYGRWAKTPVLDIQRCAVIDPQAAPEGHETLSILVHTAPYGLAGGWDDASRERFGERVVDTLESAFPGISEKIVAREILCPLDLEARYGLVRGHLYHGDQHLDQLVVRPTPECHRYRTPLDGLYLCGAGSHPGGGLTCGPGLLAAGAILSGSARNRR